LSVGVPHPEQSTIDHNPAFSVKDDTPFESIYLLSGRHEQGGE
jgi:hypothetical protein